MSFSIRVDFYLLYRLVLPADLQPLYNLSPLLPPAKIGNDGTFAMFFQQAQIGWVGIPGQIIQRKRTHFRDFRIWLAGEFKFPAKENGCVIGLPVGKIGEYAQ
jgi:hypothetical protein